MKSIFFVFINAQLIQKVRICQRQFEFGKLQAELGAGDGPKRSPEETFGEAFQSNVDFLREIYGENCGQQRLGGERKWREYLKQRGTEGENENSEARVV